MARRQYDKKFGISYNESSLKLRFSIPNSIKLPSLTAWVWLQDEHTLVISKDKPKSVVGAVRSALTETPNTPGCRYGTSPTVSKGLGPFFRMQDTTYEYKGGRYYLKIPDEENRIAPRNTFKKISEPVTKLPPKAEESLVLVERGKDEFTFRVPNDELASVIGSWILKGYQEE